MNHQVSIQRSFVFFPLAIRITTINRAIGSTYLKTWLALIIFSQLLKFSTYNQQRYQLIRAILTLKSKLMSMYFPNLEELSFLLVLALPKASRISLDWSRTFLARSIST